MQDPLRNALERVRQEQPMLDMAQFVRTGGFEQVLDQAAGLAQDLSRERGHIDELESLRIEPPGTEDTDAAERDEWEAERSQLNQQIHQRNHQSPRPQPRLPPRPGGGVAGLGERLGQDAGQPVWV